MQLSESLARRVPIANWLEKLHNIDNHINVQVIEALSYDRRNGVQSVISRLKNTNEDFRKHLEESGHVLSGGAGSATEISAVYPNYDLTTDSYSGLSCQIITWSYDFNTRVNKCRSKNNAIALRYYLMTTIASSIFFGFVNSLYLILLFSNAI